MCVCVYLGIFCAQAPVTRPSLRALLCREETRKTVRGYPAAGFSSITAVRRVTACSAGDCPGGQEGPYICSFVRSRLSVRRYKVVDAFYWGSGDVIKCCSSILDRTGALGRRIAQQLNCKGPIVVVFEISPSEKIFTTRSYPHAMRRLYVGSKSKLRRPRFVAVTTYRCRVRF